MRIPASESFSTRLLAALGLLALCAGAIAPQEGGDNPSSSAERNGSGVNPLRFTEISPAVIGELWETKVELSDPGDLGSLLVISLGGATEDVYLPHGELLCLPPYLPLDVGSGSHALPIPLDADLLGVTLSTQGAVLRSGEVQLTNAIDIKIGAF